MTKRMLIDATHAEETRVVVLDGNRLEDYDVETSTKQQLKGNIYLAKIVRVEPSLQAAFVEYGGNRHGFLAFGEIHPDYYQIPVADRQRLLRMQEEEAREDEEAEDEAAARTLTGSDDQNNRIVEDGGNGPQGDYAEGESADTDPLAAPIDPAVEATIQAAYAHQADLAANPDSPEPDPAQVVQAAAVATELRVAPEEARDEFPAESDTQPVPAEEAGTDPGADLGADLGADVGLEGADSSGDPDPDLVPAEPPPQAVGGVETPQDEVRHRPPSRFTRHYKIQEVIHRRQILLIQVVKEERGTKGAALTTFISLAGRFSVLMPNSPRGGGVSRKITQASDRRRLKEVMQELDLPRGMGLIVRTAGANRPKPEIIRDCEYLLSQWDQIRELTMRSVAPALIYEEASLIKRAIRDVYSRDVEEVLVDGEQGWRAAREYMRMLMPAHARKVQLWRETQPLFAKQQVDVQLDAMLHPTVQLRSGGYLVINQTEALVAVDVNSGRSTRERGIEETALRTNLEAAEEVARQLRLRDLAGLIVIDFIDMESRRNNAQVERRLKDALRNDRARIQLGSISHFGLLEMSRQRLRPSIAETSFVACPTCGGTGHVRSTESAALHVLRGIEEEGAKRRSAEIVVHVAGGIALYILNHKRGRLAEIEQRFGMHVLFNGDESFLPPQMRIERLRAQTPSDAPAPIMYTPAPHTEAEDEPDLVEEEDDVEAPAPAPSRVSARAAPAGAAVDGEEAESAEKANQRRRRRRRRGGRREDGDGSAEGVPGEEPTEGEAQAADVGTDATAAVDGPEHGDNQAAELPSSPLSEEAPGFAPSDLPPDSTEISEQINAEVIAADGLPVEAAAPTQDAAAPAGTEPAAEEDDPDRPRRRGRRGGRRRRKADDEAAEPAADAAPAEPAHAEPAPPAMPAYTGPTPANPFAGDPGFDVFDALEQAEERRAAQAALISAPAPVDMADAAAPAESLAPTVDQPASEPAAGSGTTLSAPVNYDPSIAGPAVTANETTETVSEAAEPAAEPSAPEPAAAPAIMPVVIGATEITGERKRGWWRR